MRATEFLKEATIAELFQPGKDWKWSFTGSEEAVAVFHVGEVPYMFHAYGPAPIWEVEFKQHGSKLDRSQKFGLTGTGNSAEVMSTIVDIMRAFLSKYKDNIETLIFSAKEDSRQDLYARMVKRLLPDWTMKQEGQSFVLTAPKQMNEEARSARVNGLVLKYAFNDRALIMKAFDPTTKSPLAYVKFVKEDKELYPQDLWVHDDFRNKGIAKSMYDHLKNEGFVINRSHDQTKAGSGFWDKHRGEDQYVWEAFDTKVPYTVSSASNDSFETYAIIGNRKIVFVGEELEPESWEVSFDQRDSSGTQFGKTGSGSEMQVFSFVIESIKELISRYRPMELTFTSSKADENRTSLYARMLKRISIPGYKFVGVRNKGDSDEFVVRSQYHQDQELDEVAVDEMALKQFTPMGDFEKPGPFKAVDKRLVQHQTNQLKAAKFFEQTPYDFRLFFSNIPGTGKYAETGPVNAQQLQQMFGPEYAKQILADSEDAITVVFVGNSGADKVMITPWIMAHRFGHAIQAGARRNQGWSTWQEAEKHFFTTVNSLLADYYRKQSRSGGRQHQMQGDLTAEYNALFNALGTQRSSRTGQIKRPYEFLYEIFAQYLKTGEVTFNPLPQRIDYGRKAWGTSTKGMSAQPGAEDLQDMAEILARDMQYMFDDVLSSSVGQVFVM